MAHPSCNRPFAAYTWTKEDYVALRAVADELGVTGEDLLLIFEAESVRNPHATYCIDGMPFAVGLNQITSDKLVTDKIGYLSLSAREQLPYVLRYFKNTGKRTEGAGAVGLYQLNLGPGTYPNEVIYLKGTKNYAMNEGLDVDGDGAITRADLAQVLARKAKNPGYIQAVKEYGGKVPVIGPNVGSTTTQRTEMSLIGFGVVAAAIGAVVIASSRK